MQALRPRLVLALLLAACGHAALVSAQDWPDPVTSASEAMPDASRSLLLDAVRLDSGRFVAVGERGHVLVSDDDATQWRQVVVPTRSTLTAIAASGKAVVAAGHEGVILHSADGGDTWQRVREEPFSSDNVGSPSNGAPLLDVLFLDDRRVLAVGAYALMLTSDDAGAHWQPVTLELVSEEKSAHAAGSDDDPASESDTVPPDSDRVEAPEDGLSDGMLFDEDELMLDDEVDPHLNALARTRTGALVMVGERGSVFRSRDEGSTWQRLSLPYGGSMFGVLATGADRILVMGLRGRAFESDDLGDSWRELETGTQATLFAGTVADDGTVSLVGAQGAILQRANEGAFDVSVFVTDAGETPTHSAVLQREDGQLMLFGERGAAQWRQP